MARASLPMVEKFSMSLHQDEDFPEMWEMRIHLPELLYGDQEFATFPVRNGDELFVRLVREVMSTIKWESIGEPRITKR